jgi:hypothetical protein
VCPTAELLVSRKNNPGTLEDLYFASSDGTIWIARYSPGEFSAYGLL